MPSPFEDSGFADSRGGPAGGTTNFLDSRGTVQQGSRTQFRRDYRLDRADEAESSAPAATVAEGPYAPNSASAPVAAPTREAKPAGSGKLQLEAIEPRRLVDTEVIHTALYEAVKADPSIKELMVHEGEQIWVACARGKVRLGDIITGCPKIEGTMSRAQIYYFVIAVVMGSKNAEEMKSKSEWLTEYMKTEATYSESMRLNWLSKVRVSMYRHKKNQLAVTCRVTSLTMPALDSIGLPPAAVSAIRMNHRGLILITGPLSSGKTSTAQAILNHRNMTSSSHIMTVEDPIETELESDKSIITTKQVGIDVRTFNDGLLDAQRQAVDILFIGEIRDGETFKTALSAAAAGMLVIATSHSDTCGGVVTRCMSMLGSEAAGYWKVLSSSLITVVRQTLVPMKDGSGWRMAADVLIPKGNTLQNLTDSYKLEEYARGTSKPDGTWISMNDVLIDMVRKGMITREAARRETTDIRGFESLEHGRRA